MKPKLSNEEINRRLSILSPTSESLIEKRMKYRPFKSLIECVILSIIKNGYITSGDVRKTFRVSTRWSLEKLHELVELELLTSKNITGSNMTEFRAILDETGEPKIYKFYEKSKE
jgi:predicted HTH transcriptional regulator